MSQIKLIAAIARELQRQGAGKLNVRQGNAVIKAADAILAELNRPHVPVTPGMGLRAWLECDETGLSSLHMARVLAPYVNLGLGGLAEDDDGKPYPRDPDDFARCVGLLSAAPELREQLSKMSCEGPVWKALYLDWANLERLLDEERPQGKCPRLYARMQALIDAAQT